MASKPTEKQNKTCSVEGCGQPLGARGFCVACYYKKLRSGEVVSKSKTFKWKHRLTNINTVDRTATCSECGEVKIRSKGNNQWRCVTDANKRSKLYKKAYRESRKVMLKDHCQICSRKEKLCWDHCHKTGLFRGTLCTCCNAAIGLFGDNPDTLRLAALYLEKATNDQNNSGTLQE